MRERGEKGCVLMKLGRNIIKSRPPPPTTTKKNSQNLLSKSLDLESYVRDFNVESNVRPDLGLTVRSRPRPNLDLSRN